MPLCEELLVDWYWYCYKLCGYILPVNYMYVSDDGLLRMGHKVEDVGAAVLTNDGVRVREIMIEYNPEEVEEEWLH